MLKKIVLGLFVLALASFQTSLPSFINLFGVKPDLLLLFVVFWSVSCGGEEGALLGLFAGFILDALSGRYFLHTFTKAISGFLSGGLKGSFAMDSDSIFPIAVSVVIPLNYLFEIASSYFLFGRNLPSLYSMVLVVLLSAVFNGILAFLLKPVFAFALRKLSFHESYGSGDLTLYRP